MRPEDCIPGTRVVAPFWGDDVGTVERIDHDNDLVWVRYDPVNGVPQLIDLDPADLEPAP